MKFQPRKIFDVKPIWIIAFFLILSGLASRVIAIAPMDIWAERYITPPSVYNNVSHSMSCDLDGDHIKDLIITDYRATDPGPPEQTQAGKIMIYFGGSSLSVTPDATIYGELDSRFGDGSGCGDFNGDGIGDLSVGAVKYSIYKGRNYVFYGRSRSDWASVTHATQANVIVTGQANNSQLGNKSAIADVNGDGKGDLLIGSQVYGGVYGRAYLLWGTTDDSININANAADVIFNNDSSSGALGVELDIGDVIGNSNGDIILAADSYNGWPGISPFLYRAVIFDGATLSNGTVNVSSADLIITAAMLDYPQFSYPPRYGDVNGDGKNDLIVGCDHFSPGGIGRLFIFYGGPGLIGNKSVTDADQVIYGEALDLFSMATTVTDINNDEIDDIITSAYSYSFGGVYYGRLYVFLGGDSLTSKTQASEADYIIDNPAGIAKFGWWTSAGDINNDGWTEFGSGIGGTGGTGAYYVFSLSHIAPTVSLENLASSFDYGTTVRVAGTATDPDSGNIAKVEYSVDGGSWNQASATDGSFDSSTEDFYFDLSSLSSGSHNVIVRATDSENATTASANYQTASFTVNQPAAESTPAVSATAVSDSNLEILPETGASSD